MRHYKIEFDAEPETAKALTAILIDQVENFQMSTTAVEDEAPPAKARKVHHIGTRTPNGLPAECHIFDLLKQCSGKTTRDRVKQLLARLSYNPDTIHSSLSRMKMGGLIGIDREAVVLLPAAASLSHDQVRERVRGPTAVRKAS